MLIPHSRPFLGTAETNAVRRVILSGQLAQSMEVSKLEQELSTFVGQRHGVAVSSGTAALYCALRSLGVKRGDSVVIPSYVCTALLNAVIMTGASPSLSDVDPGTGEMTVDTAKKVLRKNTKAAIVPHLFGTPVDAHSIEAGLGVPVIEDCAQCVGTSIGNKKTGGQTVISIFSFYATKLLCAGEGGMVATSDRRIANAIIDLREYDNRDADAYVPAFNFKMSDVHAALARQQLKKLPEMIRRRRIIAKLYDAAFADLAPLIGLAYSENIMRSVYFRYVAQTCRNPPAIIKEMETKGIACRRPIFKPLHHYLKKNGFKGTDEIYKKAISIPIYPSLSKEEVEYICKKFINALK
jgi:dTDP-4-amino-4,6-dideoxygalactose transaminase